MSATAEAPDQQATAASSAADPFGATFSPGGDEDETAGVGTTSTVSGAEATEVFDLMRSPERPVFGDAFTTGEEPTDGTGADPFAPAPAPAPAPAAAAMFDFGDDPFASAGAPAPATAPPPAAASAALFDIGDFPAPAEAPAPAGEAQAPPPAAAALFDFGDFPAAAPSPAAAPAPATVGALLDFGDLLSPAPSPAATTSASAPPAALLPGFDDFAPAPAPAAAAAEAPEPLLVASTGGLSLDEPQEPPMLRSRASSEAIEVPSGLLDGAAAATAAAAAAPAEAATTFDHIIVVTDPAEEVDDQTAIFYLESWAEGLGARRPVISYVFVEGLEASEVRKAHVVEMMPRFFGGAKTADPNRKSFLLDKTDAYAPPTPPPKNVLLMQVGPVNEGAEGETTRANVDALLGAAAASGEYTYALQGKLGGTFNSAKKAQPIAAAWAARAKRGTLSLVAAPPALPKYSYNAALRFDDDAARLGVLGSEILRVGFKNTLGRAPPVLPNGFDLTHLVQGTEAETGKGRGGYGAGANYLATQQIYNGIKGSDGAWAKLVEDGRWKGEEYMAMARAYFADKGVDPPAAEGADAPPSGSGGDGKGGHTTGTLHGLAQMCLAFDELFGLRTVLSSGAAEFKLSVEQLAASSLGSVWTEFLERMAAAPDTLLTPAYDLTLAYAVANPTLPHFTALDPADNKTVTASKVSLVSMMNDGGPAPFTLEPIVREMGVHGIMASCGTPALPIASAPPAPVVPAPRSPVRVSIGEVPEV